MDSKFINGLRVLAPSSRMELIQHALRNGGILVAVNAEKILHANDLTRSIINRNVGYPDGFGAVAALRRKGAAAAVKIPGCELWLDIVRTCVAEKTFYLVGGRQEVVEDAVSRLRREFPDIRIVGFRNGFLKDEAERRALLEDVARARPDVVFVAMGSPRQELLMEELYAIHPALYQGLGGSFDVYTGRVVRAPASWVRWNLEWLYRLLREPRRLGRQVHLVRFLANLISGRY